MTLIPMYLPRPPLLMAVLGGGAIAPFGRRRVRELIAGHLVLGLVVLFPVMGLTLATAHELDNPIRLTTYNVWFGHAGKERVVSELVGNPSDIIVVQAGFESLDEMLKKRLPDRYTRADDELAIVSRWPIRDTFVPPPLDENGVPAMFVKYVVDTPQGALRIINLHAFSPRHALQGETDARSNIIAREGQVRAAAEAARQDVAPFILVGDTNLPAMSAVKRRELGSFKDAFDEVGAGFGYTFPSNHPWMRIDRVLTGDGVQFGTIEVAPRGASDHCAVSVTFSLTP